MKERADLGLSGVIPRGFANSGSFEHVHGYYLWLVQRRFSVKYFVKNRGK